MLRVVPLYLVAVLVEQRWATERSLRESEQRFRSVANATPVFLWSTGTDKGCEFVNESWLRFCGRTLKQELGNGWAANVHPEDLMHGVARYYAAFDARERFELEYRLRRFDGEYRWVHLTGVPRYGTDSEFLGYIGSAIDVTDRRRAEETTRALAHAQRLAVMGELTALIAHEVRQPLSAIQLSAQAARSLLERSEPPLAEVSNILADIQKYNLRADDTIGTIRSFVRKQDIVRRPVDVNDAVTDVFRLVTSDAGRRRVSLRGHLEPTLPQVFADATQLQQVLVNLIVNAINAEADTPENSRNIMVITRMYDDTSVEVAVRDRGCGIPAQKLPQLFESFFTTSQQGMGLGLSIVRSIVESHHGKVWAENNVDGGGATFHFTVPTVAATRPTSSS